MPRLRRTKKNPPEGFDIIKPTLDDFDRKMRDAENAPHEGKRRKEVLWPILRIHNQRSLYIYEMYKTKKISKEVYDYTIEEKIADALLIAKWKKQGYEKLCCLSCIQTRDTNFGGTCICRVPKHERKDKKPIECTNCGCTGCSSSN